MKKLKTCQVVISEGFAFCAVLPPLIFAAVLGGAASVNVVASLMLSTLP